MKIKQISGFYGLILVAINILAVFFTSSLVSNVLTDTKMINIMNEYLLNHKLTNTIFHIFPFAVPLLFCSAYVTKLNKTNDVQQRKKLLVNLPFVYSLIGISGWISGYIINFCFGFYFKFANHVSILNYILELSFYYIFMVIFTFMGSFFVLETLNRKFVLPHFIPDGHISEIKGVFSPSITFIYLLLYLTICLFPCCVIFSSFIINSGFEFSSQNIKSIILISILLLLNL
jgi:hypothetical protein